MLRGGWWRLEEVCRVTMGHLRVTVGHLRVTLGHLRETIAHLRVTIGYFSISKHKANTTELQPKVRQTCCEAQGKGRARGRPRKVTKVIYKL